MRAAARPVASVTTLCETGTACISRLPEPREGLPWARSPRPCARTPRPGPFGRRDPTRIYKALEARLSVACISMPRPGPSRASPMPRARTRPPGCYLVVECPERWKASRWARIFMRWHTASSCRVLSASIYARGCTDCMGACASYRRPTPSRAQGTVDPAGWKPRLPVRAKLKRSEPEAGGASICLE